VTPEEFFAKVDRTAGCWLWQGFVSRLGYGEVGARRGFRPSKSQTKLAHRIAYELIVGPIPTGLHLDHLCRNTRCVSPAYLEPVTVAENTRRGLHGVLRTHCTRGHALTAANTYLRRSDNSRRCRICNTEDMRRVRNESARSLARGEEALCETCGRWFGLRLDGTIRHHTLSGVRGDDRCPGVGRAVA
jgi:hypothetical protein